MTKSRGRMTALLVAVVLMLTIFSGFSVLATTDAQVEQNLNVEQEGLLRYLGILNDENPDYHKMLTRGEFAHIAARVSSQPEYAGETVMFHDVPVEHPYFQDVHALASAGIVAGDGDGYYRPDDFVSDAEACKIFAVILGYKEAGYFADYFKTARTIGITDGITMDGTVTYGDALAMAYNVLHTEMFMPVSFGEVIEFKVQEGLYALEHYFNLVRRTGRVMGASGTTLTHPTDNIAEGYILIGDRQYVYDGEEFLGQNVVYYGIKDEFSGDIKNEIACLYPEPNKNDVLTVVDKDIVGKKGNFFYYWKNEREVRVPLMEAIDVIYNGVAYPGCQDAEWIPGSGQVKLVDNNDDGTYDLALIQSYQYLVCQGIDKANEIIYGSYPKVTIGAAGQAKNIDIRSEKGRHKIDSLKNGDVLAVLASRNTEGTMKVKATFITDNVQGMVTGISNSKIKINETEYLLTDATVKDYTVKVGETVSVYQNNGVVAIVLHASNDTYKFGYLVDATTIDSAFSSKLKVKLVDTGLQVHEYQGVDKLKIDESIYTDGALILGRLSTAAAQTYQNDITEWKYSQPVRYRLNNEGFLTHIDTLIYDKTVEGEDSLQQDVPTTSNARASGQSKNIVQGSMLLFTPPEASKMFIVANGYRDEPEFYPTQTNRDTVYTVEGYNVDPESYQAEYAVVYTETASGLVYNAGIGIVSGKSTGLDAEGYAVDMIELIDTAGATNSYEMSSDVKNISVAEGDVIRFAADPGGAITSMEVIFRVADGGDNDREQYYDNSPPYVIADSSRYLSYGTIWSYKNDIFTHTTSMASDMGGVLTKNNLYNYKKTATTVMFMYDRTEMKPRVRAIGPSEIVPYLVDPKTKQTALMINEYGYLKVLYLIK